MLEGLIANTSMASSKVLWVCSGQLDLKTAQQAIASNWIEAYQKYVSPNPPGTEPASRRASGLAATSGKVWVNTRSGKYWKPGSRYYGATKQAEFMTEKEAVQKGYRRRTVQENNNDRESQADP
jgi:hypothetical protein